jgi:hypothetical protein
LCGVLCSIDESCDADAEGAVTEDDDAGTAGFCITPDNAHGKGREGGDSLVRKVEKGKKEGTVKTASGAHSKKSGTFSNLRYAKLRKPKMHIDAHGHACVQHTYDTTQRNAPSRADFASKYSTRA